MLAAISHRPSAVSHQLSVFTIRFAESWSLKAYG